MPTNYGSEFGSSGFDKDNTTKSTADEQSSERDYGSFKASSFKSDVADSYDSSSKKEPASGIRGKVDELIEKMPADFVNKASEKWDSARVDIENRMDSAQQWFTKLSSEKPIVLAGIAAGAGVCVGLGAGLLVSMLFRRD